MPDDPKIRDPDSEERIRRQEIGEMFRDETRHPRDHRGKVAVFGITEGEIIRRFPVDATEGIFLGSMRLVTDVDVALAKKLPKEKSSRALIKTRVAEFRKTLDAAPSETVSRFQSEIESMRLRANDAEARESVSDFDVDVVSILATCIAVDLGVSAEDFDAGSATARLDAISEWLSIAAIRVERFEGERRTRAANAIAVERLSIMTATIDALAKASYVAIPELEAQGIVDYDRSRLGVSPVAHRLGPIVIDSLEWAKRMIEAAENVKRWPGTQVVSAAKIRDAGVGVDAGKSVFEMALSGAPAQRIATRIDAFRSSLGPFVEHGRGANATEYGMVVYLNQLARVVSEMPWDIASTLPSRQPGTRDDNETDSATTLTDASKAPTADELWILVEKTARRRLDAGSNAMSQVATQLLLSNLGSWVTGTQLIKEKISRARSSESAVQAIRFAILRDFPELKDHIEIQKAARGRDAAIRLVKVKSPTKRKPRVLKKRARR